MREPHETLEARTRLDSWLDRYTVTPKADLEHLLLNLSPQETLARDQSRRRWVASGARWGGLQDLWRPVALAALPVLLGFLLSSALPTGNGDSWEASEQWVFAAGGEGYYP